MPVYSVLNRQLMRVGQPREGGFEPAFIEVGEFGRVHFIPDNPCQCRPFTDVKERGSKGELINMLVHGTINRFLERFGGLDRVRTFISVVAVMSIDGSLICIGPECVCRSLHDFVRRNPELSNKVLIEVRFLDDRKYDLGSREDLARLRLLAAEFCAMEGGNIDAFVETVIDYMVMVASNEELRSEIDGWLKNPNKLPTNTAKALAEILGMHIYNAYNLVKHIYLFWRPQLQARLNTLSNEINKGDGGQGPLQEKVMNDTTQRMTKAEAVVEHDNEGEKAGNDIERQLGVQETAQESRCGRDDAPLCNDKVKSGLIYDVLSALGILGGKLGDVSDCDIATLLCEFTRDELNEMKGRVKGLSDGERAEARRLIIGWALGRVSDSDLRAFFGLETSGLEARPVEPEPVDIEEARESLVRGLEGLRDVDRYAKAVRGARSELSRIIFEVLRANMPRKDPGTLQLIASTLAGLMLERPGVIMDIVHVETRCRELGINCGGLWGAVKGAVDHVAEAVRHAKEFGNKKLRGDEAAEEVRATAEEITSEACLGIEEIKDALLGIVHNAVSDKNLANTVRELLGKVVVTRCGAL